MSIHKVYIWQNGMVMVFDYNGKQMPEYQGHIDEVREKLKAVPGYDGRVTYADWQTKQVIREDDIKNT